MKFQDDFYELTKSYADAKGYMSVQELVREALRDKIFDDLEVREEYLERLKSKDATTFLSDKEADEFDKELEKRAKLE